jgi:hypothetical protein
MLENKKTHTQQQSTTTETTASLYKPVGVSTVHNH